jgi:hypothetical protein
MQVRSGIPGYLRAVINRITDHPNKGIAELPPWNIVL